MTIAEIAKIANVSIGTVDRVLHHRGRVSEETEARIQAVIEKYGYHPNALARHLKLNKTYKIAVLIPELDSEYGYWSLIYKGITKAQEELEPFAIKVKLIEFDRLKPASMLKAGKSLMEEKADAIVLAPVLPEETKKLVLQQNELPYVFVDSPLPSLNPLTTVAQNPFKAGFCAGRIMNMLAPEGKHFACLQVHMQAYNLTERAHGFASYYKNKFNVSVINKIIERPYSDKQCYELLDEFFSNNANIDGLFITNDFAYQVCSYFNKNSSIKKIPIIGFDLITQNIECLKNGSLECIISQQPEEQGYLAIHTIYRNIVLHQKTDSFITIPIDIHFKESI